MEHDAGKRSKILTVPTSSVKVSGKDLAHTSCYAQWWCGRSAPLEASREPTWERNAMNALRAEELWSELSLARSRTTSTEDVKIILNEASYERKQNISTCKIFLFLFWDEVCSEDTAC